MKVLVRILSAFLLLTIPAIPVLSALNLISRAPDLYTYEFTKAKAANELEIIADSKIRVVIKTTCEPRVRVN